MSDEERAPATFVEKLYRCRYCNEPLPDITRKAILGRNFECKKCRNERLKAWNKKNPQRLKERKDRFLVRHPGYMKVARKKHNAKMRELWGYSPKAWNMDKFTIQSELFALNEVLPKHGFSDMILTRGINASFPFDILAKKGDEKYAIEVTRCWQYKLDPRKMALLAFFGLKLYVCFLKPNLSWFIVKELKTRTTSVFPEAWLLQAEEIPK